MDVLVKFDDLNILRDYLEAIVKEFDEAEDSADELEEAIGEPYGRNTLREAVEDFEDRWNNKRDDLREGLDKAKSSVDTVLKMFVDWDVEAAASMETTHATTGGGGR